MATTTDPKHPLETSGGTETVWVHPDPRSRRPQFPTLNQNLKTGIYVIGSGTAGIQSANELVKCGREVVMVEALDVLAGETDRTSGRHASTLDDGYTEIAKKHGDKGAQLAADSHPRAIGRVGEISSKLDIENENRRLFAYDVSQYDRNKQTKENNDEVKELKAEVAKAQSLKMDADHREGYTVKGWDGEPD